MGFDLTKYETVKQRKKRFYTDYPDGRILVKNMSDKIQDYAFIEATIFKTAEDQEKNLPFSTGHALEIRDKEKSISQYGKEYESVNYTSWVENCEESAIGRALDNAGYAGNDMCSREEIEKIERQKKAINSQPKLNEIDKVINDIAEIMKSGYFEDEKADYKKELSLLKNNKAKLEAFQKVFDRAKSVFEERKAAEKEIPATEQPDIY